MDRPKSTTLMSTVRKKLTVAIDPWVSSGNKPPFSEAQLVVMALTMSGHPLPVAEIFTWLSETFPYYRRRIAHCCWLQFWRPSDQTVREIREFQNKISRVFRQFDVITFTKPAESEPLFSITPVHADIFLRPIIGDPDKHESKHFDFFGLPAELREVIYEMVFAYPKSGLHIDTDGRKTSGLSTVFQLYTRSFEESFFFEAWDYLAGMRQKNGRNHSTLLDTKPMSEILAPLTINRQFYDEAMPCFYRVNRFHVKGTDVLARFLRNLAPARRNHVAHISFREGYDLTFSTPNTFQLLAHVENLRKLDLYMDENKWVGDVPPKKRYRAVTMLHEFRLLKSVHGLDEITFQGDCPNVEKMLRVSMLKPKVERTNKRRGDEYEPWASKPRKAKKTKMLGV